MLKIFIDKEPVSGPWGGGNKFVLKLIKRLQFSGHNVCHKLESGIDVIFCFDPRPSSRGYCYSDYLEYRTKTGCKIIQRIGDVGTHGKPELTKLVKQSMILSDYLIFPSAWAKNYVGYKGINYKNIHNAPLKIFHANKRSGTLKDTLNIVTHHWSTNPKKGFEYYKFLDKNCSKKIKFTFIGRLPQDFYFENSEYITATSDNRLLSNILSNNDLYLTASEEEAGANHVLEAAAAGLPIVFHQNGGSVPEYCFEYGKSFEDSRSMIESIVSVANDYDKYKNRVLAYDNNIDNCILQYEELIQNV
tara:strand:+ start:1161 stop:2069 length:909 start_codon:yes stop_codon:yes gene_type:complete